jgi:general secretion pathway protein G
MLRNPALLRLDHVSGWKPLLPSRAGAGFSLIELLVVVSIIAVLATIGLPLAELAEKRTKEETLRAGLREIRSALDAYKAASDKGHIIRRVGDSGFPPSLDVLVEGVVDAQSPRNERMYFLRRLPRDPFAQPEVGKTADTWGQRSYASPANDPQPGNDVYDVYSKSTETGMNGVPYRQW